MLGIYVDCCFDMLCCMLCSMLDRMLCYVAMWDMLCDMMRHAMLCMWYDDMLCMQEGYVSRACKVRCKICYVLCKSDITMHVH